MFKKMSFFIKRTYVILILLLTYIPLLIGVFFSFAKQSKKGELHSIFEHFSLSGWAELSSKSDEIVKSIIIAILASFFAIFLALITVFALWKQKRKIYKKTVYASTNIPLINPDIITAIGLTIIFGIMFGTLAFDDSGIWRVIISHIVLALPYCILFMYPRSEKFTKSQFEVSQDLGFGVIRTWWKTYFIYMLPIIFISFFISFALSLDDFIFVTLNSKITTIGKALYEGKGIIRSWKLALGSIMLFVVLIIAISSIVVKLKLDKKK